MGAVAFVILAKLAHAPVAQGIVFVIVLYLFSLLKGLSMKFFGLALLGILVSFAGIYTVRPDLLLKYASAEDSSTELVPARTPFLRSLPGRLPQIVRIGRSYRSGR